MIAAERHARLRGAHRGDTGRLIVVLGGDETGLAVLRNAAALGFRPVVIAGPGDISIHSRLADSIVVAGPETTDALDRVRRLAVSGHRCPLVATNDRWLRVVMEHRSELDERFTVLHPNNAVLEICLHKQRFAHWAARHGVPTPEAIDLAGLVPGTPLPCPLVLRPEWSNHPPGRRVPKAVPVGDLQGLEASVRRFELAGVPCVATRSLLGEAHRQYSVGVAVRGHDRLSFVAQKVRPWPAQCAVGSYVALRPHADAEALACAVLRTLGFDLGIAEVEMIETHAGDLIVIEVNPRPWTQFPLSYRSGHDFLAFLLDLAPAPPRPRRQEELCWINFTNDLFACFSRGTGLVRNGRLSIGAYLGSLWRAGVYSTFALDDPYPAVRSFVRLASLALRRLRAPTSPASGPSDLPALPRNET